MGWTPPSCNGIKVPKWKWVQSTEKERSVRDEDYDNWDRFGKKRLSGAVCEALREDEQERPQRCRGDVYLRTLLIHGARAVIASRKVRIYGCNLYLLGTTH